jgi:hypothetical protein
MQCNATSKAVPLATQDDTKNIETEVAQMSCPVITHDNLLHSMR